MSDQAEEPTKKPKLRDRILQTLKARRHEKENEDLRKATWRALHPTNVALHLPQDPEPENNATHRRLPQEHIEDWTQRKEREQIAADERAMKPAPLMFGPIPRRPTDNERTNREEAARAQIETDAAELPPLENDVLQVMRALKQSSYFRPLLDPRSEILLVREEDVPAMKRIQDMARNLLIEERLNLCNDIHRFLNPQQSYVLRLLMFNSSIKVMHSTQGQKMDTPDLKQVRIDMGLTRQRTPPEPPAEKKPRSKVKRPTTENFFAFALSRRGDTPSPEESPRPSQLPALGDGISISRSFAVTHSEMPAELRDSQGSNGSAVPDFLQYYRRDSGQNTVASSSSKPSNLRYSKSSTETAVQDYNGQDSADQTAASASTRTDNSFDAAVPDWLTSSRLTPAELAEIKNKSKASCLRGGDGEDEEQAPRTLNIITQSIFTSKPTRPSPDNQRLPAGLVWLAGSRVKKENVMTAGEARDGRRRVAARREAKKTMRKEKSKKPGFFSRLFSKRSPPEAECKLRISSPTPVLRSVTPRQEFPPSPNAPSSRSGNEKWPAASKRDSARSLKSKLESIPEEERPDPSTLLDPPEKANRIMETPGDAASESAELDVAEQTESNVPVSGAQSVEEHSNPALSLDPPESEKAVTKSPSPEKAPDVVEEAGPGQEEVTGPVAHGTEPDVVEEVEAEKPPVAAKEV